MPKQILVRNIPARLGSWIEARRAEQCMSQQEFLLSVLESASVGLVGDQLPLFAKPASRVAENQTPEFVPFKFVDLFAGIGGFRISLEKLGGTCLFSSEWDQYSQRTYKAWFGDIPHGDIRKIKPADIPDHDILAAGFPCQPFSIAGVSKKKSLGLAHGFNCAKQGNLFFYLATIIEIKRPPIFFLENVKNLQSHDEGRTWEIIKETLTDLGYNLFHKVIDAASYVPQHRERIYLVGFDSRVFGDDIPFEFPPVPARPTPKLSDILEPTPDPKYTLSRHLWSYLKEYAERHRARGNGFGFGLASVDGVTRTLSARYYKDGSEILIPQGSGKPPRRLTPEECAKLMGFDSNKFKIVVSDTQAYRQFGNAVVPLVVEAVGREILKVLKWKLTHRPNGCLLKVARAGRA
jgi:DNA (cytosine-5)-methyltransferase 1